MPIKKTTWISFFLFSIVSLGVWFHFSYPQLAFVNVAVSRSEAISIADQYLKDRGVTTTDYQTAIIYSLEGRANRYLQKTIGFEKFQDFVIEHDYDLFLWIIRFFKEKHKEEFRLTVSSSTGEVTAFKHIISDSIKKEDLTRDESIEIGTSFLKEKFNFNPENYTIAADLQNIKDNRTDYTFAWQKDNVDIPWTDSENDGTGKLSTSVTVSGGEIMAFSKNIFNVPEQFNRHLSELKNTGSNLSTIIYNIFLFLYISAIYFIFVRRNHLAMQTSKKFYIGVMIVSLILTIAASLNYWQETLFKYSTTVPFSDYIGRHWVGTIRHALFISVALIIPCLSGELLHFESLRNNKRSSFLYYIQTTFFSKDVGRVILLGYFVWFIMLGIQSLLIEIGQRHLDVWVEYSWQGQTSTAYLPFLAALTIGFKASFSEEIMYRLFITSWGKKFFKSTVLAVIFGAVIWGFGHSNYPVFPMWFRGLEVSILGIFLGWVYLRFGIIPVIIGHYLFDVFWGTSGYLLGESQPFYFYSSLIIILLPMMWSCIAFILNRPIIERDLKWHLNKHQLFNLNILKQYIENHKDDFKGKSREQQIKEIVQHGWDIAVVETAINEIEQNNKL